jgi:succinoglycan biosynthesis transport protein ExoP
VAFGDYVRVLRTFWKSILAVTFLGAVVGGLLTFAVTPQYTASAQVLFTANTAGGQGGQDLAYGSTYVQSRMINYQSLANSDRVLAPVVSPPSQDSSVGLALHLTPKQLSSRVTADFVPTSTVLTVHVTDPSADQATSIVDAVAKSLIIQVAIAELEAAPANGTVTPQTSAVTGSLITEPSKPTSPTSPNLQLFLVGGLFLGLLLALAIAVFRFVRWGTEPRTPKPTKVAVSAPLYTPPPPPAVPPTAVQPPAVQPPAGSPIAGSPLQPAPKPLRSGKRLRR